MTTATVKGICPDCGRKLAGLPLMRVATLVVKRTCPGCGTRWQIKARPMETSSPHTFTELTFSPLTRREQ